MSLSLTVLGCDGSRPGPGGACSGYLVRGGGVAVWLEAGSGTMANLQRHVALTDLDAVVVSHEHPDHWSDVEGLSVGWQHLPGVAGAHGPRPIDLYAPAGVRDLLYHKGDRGLRWHDVTEGDTVSVRDLTLTFSRTDHGPETLAVRIDGGGGSLGYSADSGAGWSLEALGPGLDLAVCEATHTSGDEGRARHMSARQAGESGRQAKVRRLVLTHRWPSVPASAVREEGSVAFGEPVELAAVGAEYAL